MYQGLLSKFYDNIMKDAESKGLRDWRRALLNNLSGDALELSCSTGANLEFYPSNIKRLALVEPSLHMCERLKEKILTNQNNLERLSCTIK